VIFLENENFLGEIFKGKVTKDWGRINPKH